MKEFLPDLVYAHISQHIRLGVSHAEDGWDAGEDEEDTLTGDLGSALRKKKTRFVNSGYIGSWSISYKKFRSKGPNAEEKSLGADGIFQIEIERKDTGEIITKGLLFQAKKQGDTRVAKMREQVHNMENIATKGSAIFEYGPRGYRATEGRDLELNPKTASVSSLADFLAGSFMECSVGLRGMYFDATRKVIIVPKDEGKFDIERHNLKHRVKIEVQMIQVEEVFSDLELSFDFD